MAIVENSSDLFGMLGMSSSTPRPLTASKPMVPPVSLIDSPLPHSSVLPPVQKTALPPIKPSQIGCGFGSDTKTVVVSGDFEGDSTRLDVVLNQSKRVAAGASKRGNRVVYAFMGNVAPDTHCSNNTGDAVDPVNRILEMSNHGIALTDSLKVSPDDVIMMSGHRELAWLRLGNPNSKSREVTRHTDNKAYEILVRGMPVINVQASKHKQSTLAAYNDSLKLFEGITDKDELSVAMMLKMVSMTQLTFRATGLAVVFLKRLQLSGKTDSASIAALITFVTNFGGTIEEGVSKLFDNGQLTPEGLGVQPAAKALVDSVITYAEDLAARYTRHSKLVHCITNGDTSNGDGGLWLNPRGVDFRVGMLPAGVDESGIRVKWKAGPTNKIEWSKALNKDFRHFVKDFLKGDDTMSLDLYHAFVALSYEPVFNPLPFEDLSGASIKTLSGVTSNENTPFGTIQRRLLVKQPDHFSHSDVVHVLDQWTTVNTNEYTPSTYWSVATWCGSTKADMTPGPLTLNLSEKVETHLRNVSVVLASLLTSRVKDKQVSEFGVGGLDGILGPTVSSQKQHMRVVAFAHESFDTAFVTLLPESFVQWSLDYHNNDMDAVVSRGCPMLVTEGFLALPDDAIVPLGFPGLSDADVEAVRADLGTRLWAIPKRRSCKHNKDFSIADYAAIDYMEHATEDSLKHTTPGFSVYHTTQTSEDSFAGVRVGLSPVPAMPNRMTLTSDVSDLHSLYRVVAVVD